VADGAAKERMRETLVGVRSFCVILCIMMRNEKSFCFGLEYTEQNRSEVCVLNQMLVCVSLMVVGLLD
jgi:hypothetical protein